MLCVRSSGNPFVLAVIHRMVSAGANRPMRSLHSSLRVIRISTNARHSERSEEPPHFRPERRTLQRKPQPALAPALFLSLLLSFLLNTTTNARVILSEAKNPRIFVRRSHPSKKTTTCACSCFVFVLAFVVLAQHHHKRPVILSEAKNPRIFVRSVAPFKEKPQLALALALFLSLLLSFLLNTSTNARSF